MLQRTEQGIRLMEWVPPPLHEAPPKELSGARERILYAFSSTILREPWEEMRVSRLVRKARVARSTFYQLFRNLDAVLLAAISPLLDLTTRCLSGKASPAEALVLATHLWENRALVRKLFGDSTATILAQVLAERLTAEGHRSQAEALFAASGLIGALLAWADGRLVMDIPAMAEWLVRGGRQA
jgi:AcrR family transcriptional regulator